MMDNFNSVVSQIMDSGVPIRTKETTGKPKVPWRIGEKVRMLKRSCLRAEHKWQKNTRNCYNKEMKISRQHHISQMINDNKNNTCFSFSTIDKMMNPTRYNQK